MRFYEAKVADVIRCTQRDSLFVDSVQDELYSILRAAGFQNLNQLRKVVPVVANAWYYILTSVGNLQTLGEEYTGTLRLTDANDIPSKSLQVLWLTLYIGGETLCDRLVDRLTDGIDDLQITTRSKDTLKKWLSFLKCQKTLLLRLHQSIFYIQGVHHNLSNRLAGIRYVLLRNWMQDDTSTQSFKIVGYLSFIYVIISLAQQAFAFRDQINETNVEDSFDGLDFCNKRCGLCAETRKNSSVTPCGHLFCWECIFESLTYQQSCPICREIIKPSRICCLQNYS